MSNMVKQFLKKSLNALGIDVVAVKHRRHEEIKTSASIPAKFFEAYEICKPYTMTPMERMFSLYNAVEYVSRSKISGDLVEVGVWKGGSVMMMALALSKNRLPLRDIYLYDTFEGMSPPSEKDINYKGEAASNLLTKTNHESWCYASLEDVKKNLSLTGYPENMLVYKKGDVKQTLTRNLPGSIAVLRLDSDWYESTYQSLQALYPLVSEGGVIIFDDYGRWKGSREATDKYFNEQNIFPLLNRVDYSARIMVKQTLQ